MKWSAITMSGTLVQIIGIYFFVMGFFPVKPTLKGNSGVESLRFDCSVEYDMDPDPRSFLEKLEIQPQFHRIVLMVVDGLPAEFLIGRDKQPPRKEFRDAMPYTHELLLNKKAVGFHARAAPPTVTMPRLKAMVSGSIAGFLDVAFNFNTQVLLDDNLIGQLKRFGWRMAMYGDETWLRLFPDSFLRYDGVSSFFVKDTVEVDHNVSRHLNEELSRYDWDLLVLHYLGLDHVGHLGGRRSSLMVHKLQEMDNIVAQLHTSLLGDGSKDLGRETLLVIASDHGMTQGGNHGGASFEETDALALFVRKRPFLEYFDGRAFQVDLAPTLALLVGVPIPKNNVGALLLPLFDSLPATEMLRALEVNSWQILKLLRVRYPKSSCLKSICSGQKSIYKDNNEEIQKFCHLFSIATDAHESWRKSSCISTNTSCISADGEAVSKAYLSFLHSASTWLARGTTQKDSFLIFSGCFFMLLSMIFFMYVSWKIILEDYIASKSMVLLILKPENWITVAGVCGHALSFNSSSLVEEEQFTLHFLQVTMWCLFLRGTIQRLGCFQSMSPDSYKLLWDRMSCSGEHFKQKREDAQQNQLIISLKQAFAGLLVLITARLLRGWHRGGVNWTTLPDIAKWLEESDPLILQAFHTVSLATVYGICCWLILNHKLFFRLKYVVAEIFTLAVVLIETYNLRIHGGISSHADSFSIMIAQVVYGLLGGTVCAVLLLSPFLLQTKGEVVVLPGKNSGTEFQTCLNFISKVFLSSWCFLQFLLQKPVNGVPILLLLVQLIGSLIFFSLSGSALNFWLKVLMLYLMGSSGHMAMGNTNTLATVDVAGAYIGLNQHSIFLSGLLAFIITYASPIIHMLGILLLVSMDDIGNPIVDKLEGNNRFFVRISLSCSIPLLLSSVVLTSFTFVMLLMQGHLFIWSVFSPKYIYVCFTVLSTYCGIIINSVASLYVYAMI
ncbi:hypothetical protein KP509_25G019500 [Ceratopteris richardii]|nr:hypothetical protein KP509_25G019500 [Ceratopteris richardii]